MSKNALSKLDSKSETLSLVNVRPLSLERARRVFASLLFGSCLRSKKTTSTRPSGPAATNGNHWSLSGGPPFTLTAVLQVLPPSVDLLRNTFPSVFFPAGQGYPSERGPTKVGNGNCPAWARLSHHVVYSVPSCPTAILPLNVSTLKLLLHSVNRKSSLNG